MAKSSGGTRANYPQREYLQSSLSKEYFDEHRQEIGKYVDENLDKFKEAKRNGTLPDWVTRDKTVRGVIDTMIKAREVGSIIQQGAEEIAARYGGRVTSINYKGFDSIMRKVTDPNDPTPLYDLGDAVRNTIIIDRQGIGSVVGDLKARSDFMKYKKQSTDYGYTGNLINLRMPNGIKAEIQVNTARMIYAKESPKNAKKYLGTKEWNRIAAETGMEGGLGHKYYEVGRKMMPSPELEEIKRKSREYYSHFS